MPWTRPQEVVVLTGAALVLAAVGLLLVARRPAPPIRILEVPASAELIVQVDGAVGRPGLHRLPAGARLADALAAAGGTRADADLSGINQARLLRDGERITIASSVEAGGEIIRERPQGPGGADRLDLNSAPAEALEALPGIGPVLARRIVQHRTARGRFQDLDDLLQVKGVGPRLLDRLRSRVMIR